MVGKEEAEVERAGRNLSGQRGGRPERSGLGGEWWDWKEDLGELGAGDSWM